jgi:hypothetical protein
VSQPTRRIALFLACIGIAAIGLVGIANADSNRYDWNCSGAPGADCVAPAGNHSWGSATAVNTANAYYKCSGIYGPDFGGYIASRCDSLNYVRVNSNQRGLCGYPNNANGGVCQNLYDIVANGTGASHGLRGVGYF